MNLFSISLQTSSWQQGSEQQSFWQLEWELVGWTMCYFLAAGTVVALVGALIRFLCRGMTPNFRYFLSLVCFAALAVLPLGIAAWLAQTPSTEVSPSAPLANVASPALRPGVIDLKHEPILQPIEQAAIRATPFESPTANESAEFSTEDVVDKFLPTDSAITLLSNAVEYLPWIWLVGTPLTFALLATGLIGSNRLQRQSTSITDGPLHEIYLRLRSSFGVSQRVGLAINERIVTPLLVGVVRPLILLPPAAVTGWTPDEVEMVLLHELAHVRRWDNLVNFLQRVVESLLFFHPAVWWVSRWVRHDREECCDAAVVAHTAAPQAYAELLVALASPSSPLVGVAMARHPLAGRIRRILKLEDEKMLVSRSVMGWFGLVTAAVVVAMLWQPTEVSIAGEAEQGVVAREGEKTTEDTKSVELEITVEKVFEIPKPSAFASPAEGEIWYETQMALIKSQFLLQRALQNIAIVDPFPPTEKWLRDHLDIRFMPNGMVLEITGESSSNNHKQLTSYLDAIAESFTAELASKQKLKERAKTINSPFLSLEDQRAADLAYKLLGLELEPLSKEDLERVKKLGHDGGLRVAQNAELTAGKFIAQNACYQDDLLIGLHVWPVKSLQDVAKILQRDDIAELTPMKFYAARLYHPTQTRGQPKQEPYHKLVSGRIKLNVGTNTNLLLYDQKSGAKTIIPPANTPYTLSAGDSVKVTASGVFPDQPINDIYVVESMGTLALGPTYGRVIVVGMTLLEAEAAVKKKLGELLTDVAVQITLHEKAMTNRTEASGRHSNDRILADLKAELFGAHREYRRLASQYQVLQDANLNNEDAKVESELQRKLREMEHARLQILEIRTQLHAYEQRANAKSESAASVQSAVRSDQNTFHPKTWDPNAAIMQAELKLKYDRYQAVLQELLKANSNYEDPESHPAVKRLQQEAEAAELDIARLQEQFEILAKKKATPLSNSQAQNKFTQESSADVNRTSEDSKTEFLQIHLKQAENQLKALQIDYQEKLEANRVAEGAVAESAIEKLKVEIEQAKLEVEKRQAQLNYRELQTRAGRGKDTSNLYERIIATREELNFSHKQYELLLTKLINTKAKFKNSDSNPEVRKIQKYVNETKSEIEFLQSELSKIAKQLATQVLYDGKPFKHWQSLWKNELKTERRIEAIKALAAFGRAGYGKQAAEAILEVAGQYDFRHASAEEEKLYHAINQAFYSSIAPEFWLPLLKEKYDADPQRWEPLIMDNISRHFDPKLRPLQIEILLMIARGKNSIRKESAFYRLIGLDPHQENSEITGLIKQCLHESNTTLKRYAIQAAIQHGVMRPKLEELSLQGSQKAKAFIRQVLDRQSGDEFSKQFAKSMMDQLVDPSKKENQSDILRNLAAIGRPGNEPIEPKLEPLLESFLDHEDQQLQVTAAVAIERLSGGSRQSVPLLSGKITGPDGEKLSDGKIQKLVSRESKSLFEVLK